MMRYLQHDTLRQKNLVHFDSWASTFGETATAIELAPEGTGYRARTRFAKFFNLPELMTLFKEVADIKTADQLNLVALHDLDCPWRPGDLEQRSGRIIRQGNRNAQVHIFRYATEGTFDSYLWQISENKQKFISQIMTSKSPVRSCEDIDEAALSFAEIKALCAGNPQIKEKMDLDIEVSRLRLLKANHQTQQYRMEDSLLRYFPEQIEHTKGYIVGLEADMAAVKAHTPAQGEFLGMEVGGKRCLDKETAGNALLDACKAFHGDALDSVSIGSYRGFTMSLSIENFGKEFVLTLKGEMSHRVPLGADVRGNLTRIDNKLADIPGRIRTQQEQLENLLQQMESAQQEVGKPFPQEAELAEKSARLVALDALLSMDARSETQEVEPDAPPAKRPSVLEALKTPCRSGDREAAPVKKLEEVLE
jgi:hypothetical protein